LIRHILAKDWKLLWPMVALITSIQIGFEWVSYFDESPGAAVLLRPLILAWYAGIAALAAAVILQDPVPGADQDWLIRPLRRTDMMLAKLAFVVLAISVPMLILNLAHAMALGFPFIHSLELILYKELYVLACLIIPVMALSATTRNMTELIVMGAFLVVVYALSLGISAFVLSSGWCPTCDTGTSWLQHIMQHAGILLGAVLVLILQYYRRRTELSRMLIVVGVVALVVVQLPWNTAFALQEWLTRSSGGSTAISLESGTKSPHARATEAPGAGKQLSTGQATSLLLQGRVDQVLDSLHRRARPADSPVAIDIPVRADGVGSDELLLVDRLEVRLVGEDGRLLYRRADIAAPTAFFIAPPAGDATDPSRFAQQRIDIPGKIYERSAAGAAQLHMDYSLTVMQPLAEYKIAAVDGLLRAPGVGRCVSQNDENAIFIQCKTMGWTPFCYSATLYGPDGRHNPEVRKCTPDYRPYLPTPINVHGFLGVDVPMRDRYGLARYPVEASELAQSYVLLKIYRERDHFKRTLVVSPFQSGAPHDSENAGF
jgi:hypothetical protein